MTDEEKRETREAIEYLLLSHVSRVSSCIEGDSLHLRVTVSSITVEHVLSWDLVEDLGEEDTVSFIVNRVNRQLVRRNPPKICALCGKTTKAYNRVMSNDGAVFVCIECSSGEEWRDDDGD